jgi:carboxypeptidase C (cathepsin A)
MHRAIVTRSLAAAAACLLACAQASAATPSEANPYFRTATSTTAGSVTVEDKAIRYHAVAGLLIVRPKGWNDADAARAKSPESSMFYVAYFKDGESPASRPITFLYNGGPGSPSVWLHMGAFGPKRVVTADHTHTAPAPYQLVNNDYSLLDASDLVFVDAPGTGFSRVAPGAEKDFLGADEDVHAYSEFIVKFLSKYGRWNSPKYLFGESYGTPRSASLVNVLETEDDSDFNGVILLSVVLDYNDSPNFVRNNPGIDQAYELSLPSYAATAWYHHKLPRSGQSLPSLLTEVEQFALGDYARALRAGSELSLGQRDAIIAKLHDYTGLPVAYLKQGNLRIDGGEFEASLQSDAGLTTGRLDSRFSGPALDPLSERAQYDPQSAAIGSAYISAFNDYVRKDLHYGMEMRYQPEVSLARKWDYRHQPPGAPFPLQQALNVMPDLANAMKHDPNLKVMVAGGYFDLATPFFQGMYEMTHLPMPRSLQGNIEYRYYESGHMVYAHIPALKRLHDDVAAFIANSERQPHS